MKKNQANSDYKDLWEKVNRKVDIEPETSAEAPEEVKEEQQAEQEETNEENDVPSDSTEAKSTCKIATQSQAVSYSLKVLSFLESKMKTYNKENKKRIPVARFKDAFCLAASEFEFQNSNNINHWCVAYINRFLDNDCKQTNFNFEVKDFSNASTECKEYGLETDFDLSDLFLQHKPEDYSHLRNIL